jgi:hypothetical protein
VVYYDPLCDGMGHKVYSGIAEELLRASIKYGYNTLAEEWKDGPLEAVSKRRYDTVFNGPAFVFALDEMIREAKIDVLFDTVFCDVEMEDGLCTAVIVENKSGRQAYRGKAVIDASGDADVFHRAGAPCMEQGNYVCYWAYITADNIDQYTGVVGPGPRRVKILAMGNFYGTDRREGAKKYLGTDVRHITEFLFKSREWALDRIKADPSMVYNSFPSQAQFRTTRRIVGEHTLLTSDAGKHFADSIGCASIFNIAMPVYEFPFGMLYHKPIKNMFAAGRIVSASNGHAWEISRTIPACAQTGEAAGCAAALLLSTGKPVVVRELQDMLKKDGVVYTMSDVMVQQSVEWLETWKTLKQERPFYEDLSFEDHLIAEL